jgi:hypothetical protein
VRDLALWLGLQGNSPLVVWTERSLLIAAGVSLVVVLVALPFVFGELLIYLWRRRWNAARRALMLLTALLLVAGLSLAAVVATLDALDLIPEW